MIYVVEKQFVDPNHVNYGKVLFYAEFPTEQEAIDYQKLADRHEADWGEVFTIRCESEHYID